MRVHELKTWPGPFAAVWDGIKRYEVRRDDRGFAVGDSIRLLEWDPTPAMCTPGGQAMDRAIDAEVVHVTLGGRAGIDCAFAVIGIRVTRRLTRERERFSRIPGAWRDVP